MNHYLKISILGLIMLVAYANCTPRPVTIVQIPSITFIDTVNGNSVKAEYFIIQNFSENLTTTRAIDSFISYNLGDNHKKYIQYDMIFYKESNETTLANVIADRKIIDRYSQNHDLVYSFSWMKGKLIKKFRFKNGKIVDPDSSVIIEDIPN